MKKNILLAFVILCSSKFLLAQRVYPLVSGVTVDSILKVKINATKLATDPITGHLFYQTTDGSIYEVFMPSIGPVTDSLRFTSAQHGITSAQGLCFKDSTMYICGNVWSSTTAIGKIVKAKLQPNGTRVWTNVVTTDVYPSADPGGDHGFSAVSIDPTGNYIYLSSGARTHLGEIRTNGGAWPNCREVPLTTRIFKFPINTVGLVLPNDSNLIDNSGYVFAWGTRNAYDMAWDANDTLFAIDNSGERDDPEELNWLRKGKNYGFPWNMGGNANALLQSPYNVNNDPLVNHNSVGYLSGWFANDPTFPHVPAGVTFTSPIRNYGTAGDFFRDSITGKVKEASALGTYITTFTPHRSPLGLVFDRDSVLAAPFRGQGFLTNFMPGGDSTGYSPIAPYGIPCPFVDPCRNLMQLHLTYNASIDNYQMTTSSIVSGLYLPVDAELVNSSLYIIENTGNIWRINFPAYTAIKSVEAQSSNIKIYPNPAQNNFTIQTPNTEKQYVTVFDINGKLILSQTILNTTTIDASNFNAGVYTISITGNTGVVTKKLVIVK